MGGGGGRACTATASITTADSTEESSALLEVKRSVTCVPCTAVGIGKVEQTRAVIELEEIINRPDPSIFTCEAKIGAVAGVRTTPGLRAGGGGGKEPPAGEPAALSAAPRSKVPAPVMSCARKKSSNPPESLLTN